MLNLEWSNIISCNFFGDDIGSMVADFFFFFETILNLMIQWNKEGKIC